MKVIADQDAKKAKKVFHCCMLRHSANYDSADILNHFKSGIAYKKDMDTQKKVIVQDFYEKDIISRVIPHKNLTKKIKLPIGEQKHVPVRVMEVSMSFSAGNGRLWQQNLMQERKSSITQSKLMIF